MKPKDPALRATAISKPIVIVCRVCAKRSKGPKGFNGKAFAGAAKRALKDARPRPRIVLSSCLGLCPKKAQAVAVVVPRGPSQLAAIQHLDDAAVIKTMLQPSASQIDPERVASTGLALAATAIHT